MAFGIDLFIGKVVTLQLETMAEHHGVLEAVEDGYVKVSNGDELWWIPVHEIVRIDPVQPKKFQL